MTEGKFMGFTLAAVFSLIFIHIYQGKIFSYYNPDNYLGFHTIIEFFSISISVSIFLYGWRMYKATLSGNYLFLATTFLLVGIIDLLHTLTFKGMPYFFGASSIPKATWFWVIARIIESCCILLLLLIPIRKIPKNMGQFLLSICIGVILFLAYFIFVNESRLPSLFIEEKGTTYVKNSIEYFVSFINFLSLVLTLYRYYLDKNHNHLYKALAFTFLFLSGLIFTIYQSVYDLDNFTGHILKGIGYYFIMKGFLFTHNSNVNQTKATTNDLEMI